MVFDKLKQQFERLDELQQELINDLEKLEKRFRHLDDILNDIIDNSQEFRALWQGALLTDPYPVLGIHPSASEDQIKKAYRSIALECHPDKTNGGDESKTRRFIEATKAYNQLTGQYVKL